MSWKPLSGGRKHNRLPFFIRGGKLYDQRFGGTHEALQAKDLLDPAIVSVDDLPLIRDLRDQLQQAIIDGDQALAEQLQQAVETLTQQINDLIADIADELTSINDRLAGGGFGAGMTVFHDTAIPGALTVSEMRQRGWAVEDGTTYEAQLVDTGYFDAARLAFTGATRNIISPYSDRGGLFVRAGMTSGVMQQDAVQSFRTGRTYSYLWYVMPAGSGIRGTLDQSLYWLQDPEGVYAPLRTSTETRPANITRIPMIFALK